MPETQIRNRKAGRRMLWDLADSKSLAPIDDRTFRLWAHMVPRFDCEGRAEVDNAALAAALGRTFFASGWSLEQLETCRGRLAEAGEWIVYGEPGKELAQDPRFHRHQRVGRGEESDSRLPPPPGWDDDEERRKCGRSTARKMRSINTKGRSSPARPRRVSDTSTVRLGKAAAEGEGEADAVWGTRNAEGEARSPGARARSEERAIGHDPEAASRRILRCYASAHEHETAGTYNPKPREADAAKRGGELNTCASWPDDHALVAEFRRTMRGLKSKGLPANLAVVLDHVGEEWIVKPQGGAESQSNGLGAYDDGATLERLKAENAEIEPVEHALAEPAEQ